MNESQCKRIGEFLGGVLRETPEKIGLSLDGDGWASVAALLAGCAKSGRPISRDQLDDVIADSVTKQFELIPDGRRIRAC